MKISKNLDRRIVSVIIEERNTLTDLLDEKFRNDKIDHALWKELMTAVIEGSSRIKSKVAHEIYSYSGKR